MKCELCGKFKSPDNKKWSCSFSCYALIVCTVRIVRQHNNYASWQKAVLSRDGFKCQECGGIEYLHTHHIKRVIQILIDLKKKYPRMDLYKVAISDPALWDIKNGITLCKKCHFKKGKIHNSETVRHIIKTALATGK